MHVGAIDRYALHTHTLYAARKTIQPCVFHSQFCLMNTNETRPLAQLQQPNDAKLQNAQGHNLSCVHSNSLDSYLEFFFLLHLMFSFLSLSFVLLYFVLVSVFILQIVFLNFFSSAFPSEILVLSALGFREKVVRRSFSHMKH